MLDKPGGRPKKQGGLYSMQLGQNNGPYLPKDIMITNKRSVKLLGGGDDLARHTANVLLSTGTNFFQKATNLLEPQDVYDEKIRDFTNYDEKYKSKLSAAENLSTGSVFQNKLLALLKRELEEYKELISTYKQELKNMNEEVNRRNIENIKSIQPLLRDFHYQLKESLHEGKNENYKLQRELDELNREKQQIQQQILFSHKRIQELEKFVGINNEKNKINLSINQKADANHDFESDHSGD